MESTQIGTSITLPPLIALSEAYKNISFYRLSLNLIYDVFHKSLIYKDL